MNVTEQSHKCTRKTCAEGKVCPVITEHPNFFISLMCADCKVRADWERDQLHKMFERT